MDDLVSLNIKTAQIRLDMLFKKMKNRRGLRVGNGFEMDLRRVRWRVGGSI